MLRRRGGTSDGRFGQAIGLSPVCVIDGTGAAPGGQRPFVRPLVGGRTVKGTMNANRAGDVTELLRAWSDGDQRALDELTPLVYAELHRLAHRYMKRERPDHRL